VCGDNLLRKLKVVLCPSVIVVLYTSPRLKLLFNIFSEKSPAQFSIHTLTTNTKTSTTISYYRISKSHYKKKWYPCDITKISY